MSNALSGSPQAAIGEDRLIRRAADRGCACNAIITEAAASPMRRRHTASLRQHRGRFDLNFCFGLHERHHLYDAHHREVLSHHLPVGRADFP